MSAYKFTISIATADRSCFRDCMFRLMTLPDKELITVIVNDNSTSEARMRYNENICNVANSNGLRTVFHHVDNFMDARNNVVNECITDYMMILDDDDWLSVDAVLRASKAIEKYNGSDMICFGVEKNGRFGKFNQKETVLDAQWKKYFYLNQFKHYSKDRLNKVYLWNAGTLLYVPSLKKYQITWSQPECDDIIPITKLYLNATKVVKINYPIYFYPIQTSVTSKKDKDKIHRLEAGMIDSYTDLISDVNDQSNWSDKTFFSRCILHRAISNSINQLSHIDHYYSKELINLRKCIF